MAGMGTRMRPLTLRTPKPLLKVMDKTIVDHLVCSLKDIAGQPIDNIGFVVGQFGAEVERQLLSIAEKVGAKGHIFYQPEALGTGHAIWCAHPLMEGKLIVAFADTLLEMKPLGAFDKNYLLVKKVKNPQDFGVVETTTDGRITRFVEKPKEFVSDLALIGVYAFADGSVLARALNYLIDNNVRVGKEYQLTTALENMKNEGTDFYAAVVDDWYDFGNPEIFMDSAFSILSKQKQATDNFTGAKLIAPVFVGKNVALDNCTIGPNAIIGDNCTISNCSISQSIIFDKCKFSNVAIQNSFVGESCSFQNVTGTIIAGDFTNIVG